MDTTARRRYNNNRDYVRRQRPSSSSNQKKRFNLKLIMAKQAAICILIAVICIGINGMENKFGDFLRGSIRNALHYDVDYKEAISVMSATFNKMIGQTDE